MKFEFL